MYSYLYRTHSYRPWRHDSSIPGKFRKTYVEVLSINDSDSFAGLAACIAQQGKILCMKIRCIDDCFSVWGFCCPFSQYNLTSTTLETSCSERDIQWYARSIESSNDRSFAAAYRDTPAQTRDIIYYTTRDHQQHAGENLDVRSCQLEWIAVSTKSSQRNHTTHTLTLTQRRTQ